MEAGKKIEGGLVRLEHRHLHNRGLEGHIVLDPAMEPQSPEALVMMVSGEKGCRSVRNRRLSEKDSAE